MTNPLRSYEYYKKKWEDTKPIRGRAEVIKPIGQRRRHWETVEKRGDDVYVCHLYNTDVVKYYPDGSIGLVADTWSTPTTADFMHTHSPFYCYKKYGKLWAQVYNAGGDTLQYPIPEEGELRLYARVEGSQVVYEPKETITIKKSVVDRVKAKDARAPLKPFLDWAKAFHSLSDGWVMDSTRQEFGKPAGDAWRSYYEYDFPQDVARTNYNGTTNWIIPKAYEYMSNASADDYMKLYLAFATDQWKAVEQRVARNVSVENGRTKAFHDMKFSWDYIKRQVWQIAEQSVDITKQVEVPVGSKTLTGVVG